MAEDQHHLTALLKGHFPIVVVETHDEQSMLSLFRKLVAEKAVQQELLIWSAAEGLTRDFLPSSGSGSHNWSIDGVDTMVQSSDVDQQNGLEPEPMLRFIKEKQRACLLVLLDFHAYLEDPKVVRLLKEIAQNFYVNQVHLVLVSHAITVPDEIERLCVHFELSIPSQDKIMSLIRAEAKTWVAKHARKVEVDQGALKLLAENLTGCTEADAIRLIRGAIYDDGAITRSDVKGVMDVKYKLFSNNSALSFCYDTASYHDVGGFEALKHWLSVRKPFFLDPQMIEDIPKGMLLVGVQGCGKSLAAKAVAGTWGVPLLKLDMGALYNKYIGETEKNIREALVCAEQLAPCVLWIDEIEKGMQGGADDTGTGSRILGTLLTWMAENRSRVFIVATANQIDQLPPELMRKGRMDEVFFVDLPDELARAAIFQLHLAKRDYDPQGFDHGALVAVSSGFSGAEIEQAVISARYLAHAAKQDLQTQHIVESLQQTRPLSVVCREQVEALRAWSQGRTVSVS